MPQMSKWISNLRVTRLMAAQVARTAGAVAAGIDGLPVILKCDETGALQISLSSAASIIVNPVAAVFASATGNVGVASAQILAASATRKYLTIQNTHATQSLYLSFTNPATVSDILLLPTASMTFQNVVPSGILYGIGSGAATTYALMTA